jgi:hypothetical protein
MRATVASDQRRLAAAIALTRTSSDRSLRVSTETRGLVVRGRTTMGLPDHERPAVQVGAPRSVRVAFRHLDGGAQRPLGRKPVLHQLDHGYRLRCHSPDLRG